MSYADDYGIDSYTDEDIEKFAKKTWKEKMAEGICIKEGCENKTGKRLYCPEHDLVF